MILLQIHKKKMDVSKSNSFHYSHLLYESYIKTKTLLNAKIFEPNSTFIDGETLLMMYCSTHREEFSFTNIFTDSLEFKITSDLLENCLLYSACRVGDLIFGCEININKKLHRMAVKCIKLLLLRGADPNLIDDNGMTALMRTCRNFDNNEAEIVIPLLLQYKADPNIICHKNKSALIYALESNNITAVKILCEHTNTDLSTSVLNGTVLDFISFAVNNLFYSLKFLIVNLKEESLLTLIIEYLYLYEPLKKLPESFVMV